MKRGLNRGRKAVLLVNRHFLADGMSADWEV